MRGAYNGQRGKFGRIRQVALRKLNVLDSAKHCRLDISYRLEMLQGDRQGQYSIRINKQYRICFLWQNGESWDVEIVDYH